MTDLSADELYAQKLDNEIDFDCEESDRDEEQLYDTSMESLGMTWRDFY